MKNILITCAFTLFVLYSFGQSNQSEKMKHAMDSVKARYLDGLALKNPIMRQVGVSTEVFSPGTMRSDLYGKSFFKGKYQAARTNFYFNIPIAHIKKNIFSASVGVSYQVMQLRDVISYESSMPVGSTTIHNTIARTSFSYTRVDSLFHRPVVYSASVTGLINPQTYQYRFTFSGVMTLTAIKTKNSTLTVGLLALIDPSAPTPFIPFIGYYHKFKSPGLEFFLDPSRTALRKELSPRGSIALSNDIGGYLALFKIENSNFPSKQVYSTLEMKSGIIYEYLLTRKLVLSINGGLSNTLKSRVLEENKSKDPFITNKQSMVPYVKVGVSFLPFWKGIFNRN